ncbi:MAG: hypothetical protein L0387_12150 [Acidobacteria bacterium]|nr:hypothetical protein [Acidobacteriota bacterium]MCI0622392.1 hypothetical protein [Acidobacteriota bacterium]MCI0724167.1 hypothetical protein [Acidobacteriota bacterium]
MPSRDEVPQFPAGRRQRAFVGCLAFGKPSAALKSGCAPQPGSAKVEVFTTGTFLCGMKPLWIDWFRDIAKVHLEEAGESQAFLISSSSRAHKEVKRYGRAESSREPRLPEIEAAMLR